MQTLREMIGTKGLLIILIVSIFMVDDLYGNHLVSDEIERQASIRLENQARRIASIFEAYEEGSSYIDKRLSEAHQEQSLKHLKVVTAVADSYYRQYLRGEIEKAVAEGQVRKIVASMGVEDGSPVYILEGESLRLKTVGAKNYPLLKEELEEGQVFEAAVNSARRNGFDFYELPLSDDAVNDMKKGIVMHYSPWDWEFVMTRPVSTNDQKKFVANVALAKVLDENTTLFAAMENLVVLSAEGYMTYHLPESPKQMRITYLDPSDSFYQAVYDVQQGALTMLTFPDGSEHLSYVLTDRYHNNKLILMQSIEDLNRQKRDLARFNRMIEAINLVLIGVLVWVFSSGFFERQE